MIGGCRNEGDEAIVENLKSLIKKYDLEVWYYYLIIIIFIILINIYIYILISF